MKRINLIAMLLLTVSLSLIPSCTVKYSFSGASIPANAQTVSIAYFPNNAAMVAPILSSTLTEALKDRFSRQTRLQLVNEGGDLAFEGEIINYTSTTASVSSQEYAVLNRLTITVRVKFTSLYEPTLNYNKSFQAFAEYDATSLLQDVQENHLISAFMKRTENYYTMVW